MANYVNRYYKFAIKAVRKFQQELDQLFVTSTQEIEKELINSNSGNIILTNEVLDKLTAVTVSNGELLTNRYKSFLYSVIETYRDGMIFTELNTTSISIHTMGYPRYWLEQVMCD